MKYTKEQQAKLKRLNADRFRKGRFDDEVLKDGFVIYESKINKDER